jgi:hypothetical protein
MRVSELEGPLLDYWVAKALGWIDYPADSVDAWYHEADKAPFERFVCKRSCWTPSTNWVQGGQIIEEQRVAVWADAGQFYAAHPGSNEHGYYDADLGVIDSDCSQGMPGTSPLIAAMRAFVASEFGGEVPEVTAPD